MINIVDVVDKQLQLYNNHDIEGFVSTYCENIELFNQGEKEPFLRGLKELRERYTQRFANPKLHAHIANRIVVGNHVIDHEHVSGILEDGVSKVVAIYEIKDSLIQRVWFLR